MLADRLAAIAKRSWTTCLLASVTIAFGLLSIMCGGEALIPPCPTTDGGVAKGASSSETPPVEAGATGPVEAGVRGKANCLSGEVEGDETDVDCGGHTCPACGAGKRCAAITDCISGVCENGACW